VKALVKLARPHHCIKNILIFLPVVFSGNLLDLNYLKIVICGFFSFSFLSSAVYIINDIADAEKDRLHPVKCHRPIASGAVTRRCAAIFAAVLFVVAFSIDLYASESRLSVVLPAVYFILNIGYSFGLKEIPIVDITILVSGFLIRVLYGSVATGIPMSAWMYLTVMAISFYLGLGKRRNELARNGSGTRSVLKYYTYEFLDKNMYLSNALMLIFYSLWCTSSGINERFSGKMLWTVPLVILISMKYSLNIEGNSDGDPVEVILKDKMLVGLSVVYALTVLFILYPIPVMC